jgi:hypothetical protein
MTINQVDWNQVKGLVENGLQRLDLSKKDPKDSLDLIRQRIDEVLDIYVQNRYKVKFRIETSYKMGSYKASLFHELTELCSWSGNLA